ncbi:MAG TPA: PAS domain S-box protein, partial [bacterium]|nr:PAS domain S-box protein [bacterium]
MEKLSAFIIIKTISLLMAGKEGALAIWATPLISEKRHLIRWILLISLLFIIGGIFFYRLEAGFIRREKKEGLIAVAELKASQIAGWYADELEDAALLAQNARLLRLTQRRLTRGEDYPLSRLLGHLSSIQQEHGYAHVALFDTRGNRIAASDPEFTELDTHTAALLPLAVAEKTVISTGLYECGIHDIIHLDFLAPVLDAEGEPVAVLILQIDPSDFLFPLIHLWPTPSRTAETLIVRIEGDSVLFLNELRHWENAAMRLRISVTHGDVPAVRAALGHRGVFEGRDYRGTAVLSAVRPVEGTPWFMVVKVDRGEIFSELRFRTGVVIGAVLLLILAAVAGLFWIYHYGQKNIFRDLYAAEKELREIQEEYKATLYGIGDAVITTDTAGAVRHMNPVAESLTGWTESEARGVPLARVFRIISEETRSEAESPVGRVLREGVVVGLANHTLLIAKDGREIPVADSGAPIRNEAGEIAGVVLVFRDQTAERRARKEILESRRLLQDVLDTVPARVFWKDRESRYLGCNLAFARDAGLQSPDDLIGKTDFEMTWRDQAEQYRADDKEVIESGPPKLGYEEPETTPDGGLIWLRTNKVPLRDAGGGIIGVLGTYEDITEQKRADEALRESEERYRNLFENNHAVMLVVDPEGGAIVDANPAAAAYYGWTRKALRKKKIEDINTLPPGEVQAEMERARDERRNHFFFRHRLADGNIREVEVYSGPISLGGRPLLYSIIHDITERKRAEEALKEKTEELDRFFSCNLDLLCIADTDGRFRRLNAEWQKTLGYPLEELEGKRFLDFVHPDDQAGTLEAVSTLSDGKEILNFINRYRCRDGSYRWIEWRSFPSGKLIYASARDITEQKRIHD